jgi:hypothetical protein
MPVEAWPAQTPPLVRLACWLGNRPLIEAGLAAGRPFGLPPAGFASHSQRLREKENKKNSAHNPPHMEAVCLIGGYLPKPPNPFGSFTCRIQAAQIRPQPMLISNPKTTCPLCRARDRKKNVYLLHIFMERENHKGNSVTLR